ncbi:MAG: DUF1667 domain-containing protein, partial [Elusimicrobiota bacterium]|nr:DUF1667 domain-containing protein [Elusimicrobiota bacterium]
AEISRVPVKTKIDIPKNKIFEAMKTLQNLPLKAPTEIGDIAVKNVAETGIDFVVTRKLKAKNL